MRITAEGFAVADNDTHFSQWIAQTGQIDHGQRIAERFAKWFGPGDTAIDVGACLGDHTVPYAQIVGHTGKVYAFEPNQEAYECLIYNTKNYNQIQCFNFGLSDAEQDIGFVRHPNLGASYLEQGTGTSVHIKPLDSLIDSYDFSKTKFIKIDVEGFELNVLEGAVKIITQYRPVIMIEIAGCHQARYGKQPSDIYAWLTKNGYTPEQILDVEQYDLVAYPNK